jgi:hypothetical protein
MMSLARFPLPSISTCLTLSPSRAGWHTILASRLLLRRYSDNTQHTSAGNTVPIEPSPPSLASFKSRILPAAHPTLLRGCIANWPALTRWSTLEGLKNSQAAARAVPVEVARIEKGRHVALGYNSRADPGTSWDKVDMPLDVFLDALIQAPEYAEGSVDEARWAVYLAQYALLDEVGLTHAQSLPSLEASRTHNTATKQAPSLRADVTPPLEYLDAGRGDRWPTNVWIGAAGTFTPIHKDPYHNLFCQSECCFIYVSIPYALIFYANENISSVVGQKRVCIYPPSSADDLHLMDDPLQRNTSRIPSPSTELDCATEEIQFPRFKHARKEGWEVDVQAGEVLFIPRGFFHSVQSLTKSVSVNSWFL